MPMLPNRVKLVIDSNTSLLLTEGYPVARLRNQLTGLGIPVFKQDILLSQFGLSNETLVTATHIESIKNHSVATILPVTHSSDSTMTPIGASSSSSSSGTSSSSTEYTEYKESSSSGTSSSSTEYTEYKESSSSETSSSSVEDEESSSSPAIVSTLSNSNELDTSELEEQAVRLDQIINIREKLQREYDHAVTKDLKGRYEKNQPLKCEGNIIQGLEWICENRYLLITYTATFVPYRESFRQTSYYQRTLRPSKVQCYRTDGDPSTLSPIDEALDLLKRRNVRCVASFNSNLFIIDEYEQKGDGFFNKFIRSNPVSKLTRYQIQPDGKFVQQSSHSFHFPIKDPSFMLATRDPNYFLLNSAAGFQLYYINDKDCRVVTTITNNLDSCHRSFVTEGNKLYYVCYSNKQYNYYAFDLCTHERWKLMNPSSYISRHIDGGIRTWVMCPEKMRGEWIRTNQNDWAMTFISYYLLQGIMNAYENRSCDLAIQVLFPLILAYGQPCMMDPSIVSLPVREHHANYPVITGIIKKIDTWLQENISIHHSQPDLLAAFRLFKNKLQISHDARYFSIVDLIEHAYPMVNTSTFKGWVLLRELLDECKSQENIVALTGESIAPTRAASPH